jgi:hypothetical protein
MDYLTEQMVVEFFLVQDKPLTLEDLSAHFYDTPAPELYTLVTGLVVKRFLDEDLVRLAWTLSTQAKKLIKANQQPLNQNLRFTPFTPDECLISGRAAWIAILLALIMAASTLVGFLMLVE